MKSIYEIVGFNYNESDKVNEHIRSLNINDLRELHGIAPLICYCLSLDYNNYYVDYRYNYIPDHIDKNLERRIINFIILCKVVPMDNCVGIYIRSNLMYKIASDCYIFSRYRYIIRCTDNFFASVIKFDNIIKNMDPYVSSSTEELGYRFNRNGVAIKSDDNNHHYYCYNSRIIDLHLLIANKLDSDTKLTIGYLDLIPEFSVAKINKVTDGVIKFTDKYSSIALCKITSITELIDSIELLLYKVNNEVNPYAWIMKNSGLFTGNNYIAI